MKAPQRPMAVFRADAAAHIGNGHLSRCAVLANALAERDWRLALFATPETIALAQYSGAPRMELVAFPKDVQTPEAEVALIQAALEQRATVLVLDHYQRGLDFERLARRIADAIVVIEDFPGRPHLCDVLVDQTVDRLPTDYRGLVPTHTQCLMGAPFALIHPALLAARPAALRRREEGKTEPLRLLITFGGTDPVDATSWVLRAVAKENRYFSIDVILTRGAAHLARVEQALLDNACLHVSVSREKVADLMARADLAVGAAGVTTAERCCLGLPTVMMTIADNQRDIAAAVSQRGAALHLGSFGSISETTFLAALRDMCNDHDCRRNMGFTAAELIDGHGVGRVANSLVQVIRNTCDATE